MFASSKGRLNKEAAHKIVGYLAGSKEKPYLTSKGEMYLGQAEQSDWLGSDLGTLGLDREKGNINISLINRVVEGYAPEKKKTQIKLRDKNGKLVKDPKTGKTKIVTKWVKDPLVKTAGDERGLGGMDITLSVPKSVSVVWAWADPDLRKKIEELLDQTSADFVKALEDTACVRRKVNGKDIFEKPASLFVGRYRHSTSRPVNGIPDPQWHHHLFFTPVALRQDGKFGTIDPGVLLKKKGMCAAMTAPTLINGLRDLGFSIVRKDTAWEIEGIPQDAINLYSQRTAKIEEEITNQENELKRPLTREEKDNITLKTREKKNDNMTTETYFALLEKTRGTFNINRLRHHKKALDPNTLLQRREQVIANTITALSDTYPTWSIFQLLVQLPIEGELLLTKDESKNLIKDTEQAYKDQTLPALLPGLVVKKDPNLDNSLTSEIVQAREREVMNVFKQLQKLPSPRYTLEEVTRVCKKSTNPDEIKCLSDEQISMVHMALTQSVSLVEAPAGTGKGTVAKAILFIEKTFLKHKVYAIAMAGQRAEAFGKEIHADGSFTTEAFENAIASGYLKLNDGDVLLIDEVSQLETNRWQKITSNIGDTKVRVALFGDRKQLDAIGVGGLFEEIAKQIPQEAIGTLTHNYRNKNDDYLWRAFRSRNPELVGQAVKTFEQLGLLSVKETPSDAIKQLILDWGRDHRRYQDESQLIVTDRSNYDIDKINDMISQTVNPLKPQITYTYYDAKKNYTRTETLREGDPIVATAYFTGLKVPNQVKGANIKNGTTGTLIKVEENQVTVNWMNGKTTIIPQDKVDRLRLAYCRHVSASQGATVDRVYDLMGGWQTDSASAYVAVSRARIKSRIYSDVESLKLTNGATDDDSKVVALTKAFTRDKQQIAGIAEENNMNIPWHNVDPPRQMSTHKIPSQGMAR